MSLDRAGPREDRLRQRHANKAKDYFTPLYPPHVFLPWIDISALRFTIWVALRMPNLVHLTKYSAAFAAVFTSPTRSDIRAAPNFHARQVLVLHLHHAAAVHHRATRGRARGRRSDRGDGKFHLGRAGFLELQRRGDGAALVQGMFEVEEHQVRARWLEHHRLAGLDFKAALRRPHFHYAVFRGHGVDLAPGADVAGDTAKPIRRRAVVGDSQVASA
jgi:hypothetical protein